MKAARHHLESLDVFRGLTIAGMILVNNPGDWNAVLPPLLHADWNGCTLADLVFPFFIFIMGVAMPLAFARRMESGRERRHIIARASRRAVVLIALGLVLNAVAALPSIGGMRFPGVLQRIGLVYFAATFIVLETRAPARILIIAILAIGHWLLLAGVPFGGQSSGGLTPEWNPASYIDKAVFGRHTLAPSGADPEGLLGTLPALATALVGTLAGWWMRVHPDARRRVVGLAGGGAIVAASGLAWSLVLPLNKPLWTGSYAVFTAGLAALAFACCYWLIDVRATRRWARPFVWMGVNPLAIYFLAELFGHLIDAPWITIGGQRTTAKTWVFFEVLEPSAGAMVGDAGASLLFALITVVVWIAVAGALYRRGIRIQA